MRFIQTASDIAIADPASEIQTTTQTVRDDPMPLDAPRVCML